MDNTHHKHLKGMKDVCPIRDRISELPEPIIHHILSFLETKFVVRTSILSKRWWNIWTTMPTFDLSLQQGHQELETKTFESFVDKMFAVRQPLFNITKFALRSDEHLDASKVYHWISTLVRCNIEELNLASCVDKQTDLPISLFTCESLAELRLQLNIFLGLPGSISTPKLKLLHLSDIGLDKLLAEQLIFNAPLLEELILSKCLWSDWNYTTLNISAPALNYLRLDDPVTHDGVRNGTVRIDAPNLRHLSCVGNIAKDYILSSFPLLEDAEVCFKFENQHLETRGAEIGLAASKLVGALSNVRSLIISGETLEALSFANDLPTFQNLTHLTVTSECKFDKVLLQLFQSTPNLESLVFDKGLPMCTIEDVFWALTVETGCLFPRLKSVHMKKFSWVDPRELGFIKLVLINSKVLEKVTLQNTPKPISGLLAKIEGMEKVVRPPADPLARKRGSSRKVKKARTPFQFQLYAQSLMPPKPYLKLDAAGFRAVRLIL